MKCGGIFDADALGEKLLDLERKAAEPDFWSDPNAAKVIIDESNRLRGLLKPLEQIESAIDDVDVLAELAGTEDDPAQAEQAMREAESALGNAEKVFRSAEVRSLLNGELDANNAYLTLHAGAGGTESCDWAEMLLRMYRRYCERRGYAVDIMDLQSGEEAGIKSVTLRVSGDHGYGFMKAERGVHRLVRISPFDANKRRHTSFAAMDVVAEVEDDIEVEIADEDLRVDTYRSSGAGGQHVNTTDSAVRITHLPTGIVVACQAERSQHKNRAKAMKLLRARVYEWQLDQKRKSMDQFYGAKGEIAWGSQIRSYVLQPYTMVKDHRTNTETSNVDAVLDGDIHSFVESYLRWSAKEGKG